MQAEEQRDAACKERDEFKIKFNEVRAACVVWVCGCSGVHQYLTRLLSHVLSQLKKVVHHWRSLIDFATTQLTQELSDAPGGGEGRA
jgi:hypothetical protein